MARGPSRRPCRCWRSTAGQGAAGGQSLVPLLAMWPDPAGPPGRHQRRHRARRGVRRGRVTIAVLVRHRRVERDRMFLAQLLRQALAHVAHPTIRNRGTKAGLPAHADPAGEPTAVLALCDGTVTARSAAGIADHRCMTFSASPTSALAPDVSALLPGPTGRQRQRCRDCSPERRLRPCGRLRWPRPTTASDRLRRAARAWPTCSRARPDPPAGRSVEAAERPGAASTRSPTCTPPPTTGGIRRRVDDARARQATSPARSGSAVASDEPTHPITLDRQRVWCPPAVARRTLG